MKKKTLDIQNQETDEITEKFLDELAEIFVESIVHEIEKETPGGYWDLVVPGKYIRKTKERKKK